MVVASTPDNSTHHVYVYGGGSDYQTPMFGMNDTVGADMYILSMPSFQWQPVTPPANAPIGRQLHTCHLINQRQMLLVGGHHVNSTLPPPSNCTWDEMHVFDLTTLTWQDSYAPATTTYQVPDVVQANIGAAKTPLTGWDDDNLKHIFQGTSPGRETQQQIYKAFEKSDQRTRSATIAAGLLGGLAVIFLFTTLFGIYRRRQENKEMSVQLEHIKTYLGFTDMSPTTSTYVSESSRPMTLTEKFLVFLGVKGTKALPLDDLVSYCRF